MKNIIIACILILILLPYLAKSQTTNYDLPPKSFYSYAKITLRDFTKFECKDLSIKSDSVSFHNINMRLQESIALSDLNHIRVIEGNYGFKGAVLGFFAFQSYTLLFGNQDNSPFNYDKCGPIISSSLIGAGVGCVVGLMIPKWKTYYFHKKNKSL